MERTYTVYFGVEPVGCVDVQSRGLYYYFHCCCEKLDSTMYYLNICWEGGKDRLGLLVPEGDNLCLRTKLPVKRVGQGEISFKLQPKLEKLQGQFVPVFPEEPFAYLQRLEGAYLAVQNSQTGIILNSKKCKIRT